MLAYYAYHGMMLAIPAVRAWVLPQQIVEEAGVGHKGAEAGEAAEEDT